MSRSAPLRAQHKELVAIVTALSAKLSAATVAAEAPAIRSQLATLAGKLNVHLAMEDKSLYPVMSKSSDPLAQKVAREFMDEMGGLAGAFKSYLAAWPNAESIQAKPAEFCESTRGIFAALAKRIQREETVLYPLADKL